MAKTWATAGRLASCPAGRRHLFLNAPITRTPRQVYTRPPHGWKGHLREPPGYRQRLRRRGRRLPPGATRVSTAASPGATRVSTAAAKMRSTTASGSHPGIDAGCLWHTRSYLQPRSGRCLYIGLRRYVAGGRYLARLHTGSIRECFVSHAFTSAFGVTLPDCSMCPVEGLHPSH